MAEPEATASGFGTVTVRAVLLGLVTVVFMCFHANYEMHITGSSVMTLSNFPICALIVFVVWVILNAVWRAATPRHALKPMELLTIMIMAWAAGMMPGRGWSGPLVGILAAPAEFATAENRWDEIFRGLLRPGGLLPTWAFPNVGSQAAKWFYSGLPSGDSSIPWAAWAVPFFWWGTAAAAMIAVAVGLSVVFHRQWVQYERLNFPLATVPIALVTVREGERLPPIFRNRMFWIGVALSGGVLCWNIVGYFARGWPRIGIYATAWEIRQEIVTGFPYVSFRIYPPVIGFLYLANLDLLFSLWVFWFVGWLTEGAVDTMGLSVGRAGKTLTGSQLVLTLNYGALVCLTLWSVWVARKHLKAVGRAAVSSDRRADNPGGAVTYRTALVMLGLGLAYLVFFGMRLGMSLWVALPALFLVLVGFFVTAKYMAATGMPYVSAPSLANGGLLTNIAGNDWMSVRSAVGLGLFHSSAFGAGSRIFGLGMMPHALRVGDQVERGRSRLLLATVLALGVGAAFSIWHTTWLGYNRAGWNMDNFTIRGNPPQQIGAIAKAADDITKRKALSFDGQKFAVWAGGFGVTALLTFLHMRISWWPLHPVGFAFSGAAAATTYWLCIFIVWLAKLIILRLGGVRLYEKAKPLFIGLIVGYVFGLICSYGVDALFFPGQEHVVEDW